MRYPPQGIGPVPTFHSIQTIAAGASYTPSGNRLLSFHERITLGIVIVQVQDPASTWTEVARSYYGSSSVDFPTSDSYVRLYNGLGSSVTICITELSGVAVRNFTQTIPASGSYVLPSGWTAWAGTSDDGVQPTLQYYDGSSWNNEFTGPGRLTFQDENRRRVVNNDPTYSCTIRVVVAIP